MSTAKYHPNGGLLSTYCHHGYFDPRKEAYPTCCQIIANSGKQCYLLKIVACFPIMEWFSVDMGALDDLFEGLPTTLSVSEAAKVFNVSEHIIRTAISSSDPNEKLPALNLGRGYVILTADFKKWAQRRYTGHTEN